MTLDFRDSKLYPHSGWAIDFGTDYAGLGGNVDLRARQFGRPPITFRSTG